MRLSSPVRPGEPLLVVAVEEEAVDVTSRDPVLVTGVGKLRAGVAVASVLAGADKPSVVINFGTAGALVDGLEGIHEVGTVVQHDFDDVGLSVMTGRHDGAPIVLGEGPVLATGDVFVSDTAMRDALAQRAQLVDMEGYAVAFAAVAAGVPVRLVKLVSDPADEDAFRTWAEQMDGLAMVLGQWVRDHIG